MSHGSHLASKKHGPHIAHPWKTVWHLPFILTIFSFIWAILTINRKQENTILKWVCILNGALAAARNVEFIEAVCYILHAVSQLHTAFCHLTLQGPNRTVVYCFTKYLPGTVCVFMMREHKDSSEFLAKCHIISQVYTASR
jgi:hypothetical protein